MFRTNPAAELTCDRCRLHLDDYVDEALPVALTASVCAHLESCAACATLAQDFGRLRADLRALPHPQTSAGFEAALSARLHDTPARTFRTTARGALRPLLALGACAATVAGLVFFHPTAPVTQILPAPPASVDLSLVGHCVAQHKADADTQPLADPSARVLSDRLADAGAGEGAGDSGL